MNEMDFIREISKKLNIEYGEANKQVKIVLECIKEELLNGGNVKIVNFGNFEVVHRAAKKGHSPHTHEIFDIPACLEPVFKPGKELKEVVKENNII